MLILSQTIKWLVACATACYPAAPRPPLKHIEGDHESMAVAAGSRLTPYHVLDLNDLTQMFTR